MKTCPGCQKTYNDPTLNFCLDCGATLTQGSGNAPPPTVFINQPQPTNPNSPGEFQIGEIQINSFQCSRRQKNRHGF
jgi:hypothetical protein